MSSLVFLPGFNITYSQANLTSLLLSLYFGGIAFPSSGPPGILVSLSGGSASGGEIDVYFDNSLVANVTGQRGAWTALFQVPNVAPGNHSIRVVDEVGRWVRFYSFVVTSTSITFQISRLLPYSLLLLGSGFAAVLAATLFICLLAIWTRRQKRPE
jgi:hypothetical protein